jgi:hypothetical protein
LTGRSLRPRRRGIGIKSYQSLEKFEVVLCVLEIVEIMPLRIRVDPPMENHVVGREMREICARLEAMEAMQRRTHVAEDVSDEKIEEVEVE